MQYYWIDQHIQLLPIIEQLQQSSCNALDTEFIKVDTLYPKLGVLQLHINHQTYLIDGTLDLSEIWQQMFQAKQNIFHACGEDIDLIYHYSKKYPLSNVFDTQVAMAFLGHGMQVGYQTALSDILGIQVEKDQTRSDWLARPLSDEQKHYAASDVFYLQDLADHLIQQLKKKQLYKFVQQDCQAYCQLIAEHLPIVDIYLDFANYRHSSRQLMQLKQLASWREQLAIEKNIPRSYIIKNHTMNKILERPPHNIQQLVSLNELKPAAVRQYGKDILRLLHDLPAKEQWPVRLKRPYHYQLEQTKTHIDQLINKISQKLEIPIDVLIRKKWLAQLNEFVINNTQDLNKLNPYLTGWRLDILTLPLIEIIQNDVKQCPAKLKSL